MNSSYEDILGKYGIKRETQPKNDYDTVKKNYIRKIEGVAKTTPSAVVETEAKTETPQIAETSEDTKAKILAQTNALLKTGNNGSIQSTTPTEAAQNIVNASRLAEQNKKTAWDVLKEDLQRDTSGSQTMGIGDALTKTTYTEGNPYKEDLDKKFNTDEVTPEVREASRKVASEQADNPLTIAENSTDTSYETKRYTYMTTEEKDKYNTLYGLYGKQKAEEYRHMLYDDLNKRIADAEYKEKFADDGSAGDSLKKAGYTLLQSLQGALADTVDQNAKLDIGRAKANTVGDYIAQNIRNNDQNSKAGNIALDLLSSTGNMAPGMIVGAATGNGVIGDLVFAMGAQGNAYREALHDGNTQASANAYSWMQAADETVTNVILGGIGALGGGALMKALGNNFGTKLADGLAKTFKKNPKVAEAFYDVFKLMGNASSEAAQEYLQYFTEVWEKELAGMHDSEGNPVTSKDYHWNDEEAFYAAMLGAMNSGLLNVARGDLSRYGAEYEELTGKGTATETPGTDTKTTEHSVPEEKTEQKAEPQQTAPEAKAETPEIAPVQDDKADRIRKIAEQIADGEDPTKIDMSDFTEEDVEAASDLVDSIKKRGQAKALKAVEEEPVKALKKAEDVQKTTENVQETTIKPQKTAENVQKPTITEAQEGSASEPATKAERIRALAESMVNGDSRVSSIDISDFTMQDYAEMEQIRQDLTAEKPVRAAEKGAETSETAAEPVKALKKTEEKAERLRKMEEKLNASKALKTAEEVTADAVVNKVEKTVKKAVGKTGTTVNTDAVNYGTVDRSKKMTMSLVNGIAQASGMNVSWYTSKADENGNFHEDNGWYDPNTNTIHLDTNAGADNVLETSRILNVASHEITHSLKENNREAYDEIRKIVTDMYKADGSYDERVKAEEDRIRDRHRNEYTEEEIPEKAIDEIVARTCEDLLYKGDYAKNVLSRMRAETRKTFAGKIKDFINKVTGIYDRVLSEIESKSAEAAELRKNKEELEKLSKAFDKAMSEAEESGAAEAVTESKAVEHSTRGNGYDGYSMSNNARKAYSDGEMPLSKWAKTDLLEAIREVNPEIDCSKVNAETLKEKFLKNAGWHHTSMYYNKTDFYALNTDFVEKLTQSDVDEIANNQKKTEKKERNEDTDKQVDEAYSKALAIVEAGIVKTEGGAIKKLRNMEGFEESYSKAVETIKERDSTKVDQWRKLPEEHYRREYVNLYDTDIEAYIKKMYADKKLSKNSNAFKEIEGYISNSDSIMHSDRDTNVSDKVIEAAEQTESKKEDTITSTLTPKARVYATKSRIDMLRKVQNVIPEAKNLNRESLREITRAMAEECLTDGKLSEDTKKRFLRKLTEFGLENGDPIAYEHRMDEIDSIIGEFEEEMYIVDRYRKDTMPAPEVTVDEVKEAYKKVDEQKKAYAKAQSNNLLTGKDNFYLGLLMRGDCTESDLKNAKDINVKGIKEVYKAKREYEDTAKKIEKFKKQRHQALNDQADDHLDGFENWQSRAGSLAYDLGTAERNVEAVAPKEKAENMIATYFTPVHDDVAHEKIFKNEHKNRIKALDLNREVAEGNKDSESMAVQFIGEVKDNISRLKDKPKDAKVSGMTYEEWEAAIDQFMEDNPNLDYEKIENAIKVFHEEYDALYEKINEVRIRNGYEPVPYRQNYFPHFIAKENDTLMSSIQKAFGFKTSEDLSLPTTIAGMTQNFKPGIRWSGFALQRKGFDTTYDAVLGYESYVDTAADVIYLTDDIQRLRALARQIRYNTSDEATQKKIDDIFSDDRLSMEEKMAGLQEITGKDKSRALSSFVVWLDEYTNILAGKKSKYDRIFEDAFGRNAIYKVVKKAYGNIGKNMVAVNPASALTNVIPITQALMDTKPKYILQGMVDTLKGVNKSDGLVEQSSYLTNRIGEEVKLVEDYERDTGKKGLAKAGEKYAKAIDALAEKFNYVDDFTTEAVYRARYQQNRASGMSETASIDEANDYIARIQADRSKGSMPNIFSSNNPLIKTLSMYQLEVKNEISWLAKDVPKALRKKTVAAAVASVMKFLFGTYLFNDLYEWIVGRRPALDPVNLLNDTVGDLTGYKLPNMLDLAFGEDGFKTEQKGITTAGINLAENVAEEVPFLSGVLGGGRVPISSALPDWEDVWKSVSPDSGWGTKKRLTELAKNFGNTAYYMAMPGGGSQIKKMTEGAIALARGGSYSVDKDGNDQLQYPIFKDNPADAVGSVTRTMIFGKSANKTARDWVENEFDSFNAKQTALYQDLTENGLDDRKAYEVTQTVINLNRKKEDGSSYTKLEKQQKINRMGLTEKQKQCAFDFLGIDNTKATVNGALPLRKV